MIHWVLILDASISDSCIMTVMVFVDSVQQIKAHYNISPEGDSLTINKLEQHKIYLLPNAMHNTA